MSTRSATACRIAWSAITSRSSSTSTRVQIFHGVELVATHARSTEPFARVVDPAHYDGLWRRRRWTDVADASRSALGRDLADYAAVVADGAQ